MKVNGSVQMKTDADRWEVLTFHPSETQWDASNWLSGISYFDVEAGCLAFFGSFTQTLCLYRLFQVLMVFTFCGMNCKHWNEAACSPTCWYGCKIRRIKADKTAQPPACLVWVRECAPSATTRSQHCFFVIDFFNNLLFHVVCVCVFIRSTDWTDVPPDFSSAALFIPSRQLLLCLRCILQHHSRAERVTACMWRTIHCKIYKPFCATVSKKICKFH